MHSYRYKPTQSNKITDECQGIINILADRKTAVAKNAAMQYG